MIAAKLQHHEIMLIDGQRFCVMGHAAAVMRDGVPIYARLSLPPPPLGTLVQHRSAGWEGTVP